MHRYFSQRVCRIDPDQPDTLKYFEIKPAVVIILAMFRVEPHKEHSEDLILKLQTHIGFPTRPPITCI